MALWGVRFGQAEFQCLCRQRSSRQGPPGNAREDDQHVGESQSQETGAVTQEVKVSGVYRSGTGEEPSGEEKQELCCQGEVAGVATMDTEAAPPLKVGPAE